MNKDEPIDLTDFVTSFEMNYKTDIEPKRKDDGDIFGFEVKSPTVDIDVTADVEKFMHMFQGNPEQKAVMRMTYKGRFWFDYSTSADVVVKNLQFDPETGKMAVEYDAIGFELHADSRWLARFLRWVLRRNPKV